LLYVPSSKKILTGYAKIKISTFRLVTRRRVCLTKWGCFEERPYLKGLSTFLSVHQVPAT
jgi:hypothetical protein